jgi:hypothetical protein
MGLPNGSLEKILEATGGQTAMIRHNLVYWLVAYFVAADYAGYRLCAWYERTHPKANPTCTQDILCEHWGRHRRGCVGGTISAERYSRLIKGA